MKRKKKVTKRRKRVRMDVPRNLNVEVNRECTPELTRRYGELLRRGVSPQSACGILYIPQQFWREWLRRGSAWLNYPKDHPDDIFCGFFARTHFESLGLLEKFAADTMTSKTVKTTHVSRAVAILERRFGKVWGKRETIELSDDQMEPDERFL